MINAAASRGATGIQNAALAMGGYPTSPTAAEQYDGTAWSALPDSPNTIRHGGSAGKVDGAFFYGRYNQANSTCFFIGGGNEICTGTYQCYLPGAWSAGGNMIVARQNQGGSGVQNAALSAGGITPTTVSCTEEYDGSSWSTGGATILGRGSAGGAGTQNAGLLIAGYFPGCNNSTCTEEYDGSSWSSGGAFTIALYGSNTSGTQNAAISSGGCVYVGGGSKIFTMTYDGSSWTNGPNKSQCTSDGASAGPSDAALSFGGNTGQGSYGYPVTTEEYNGISWSSGGTMNYGGDAARGAGTQNDALRIGGRCPGPVYGGFTEKYNGTAWSVQSGLATCRLSSGGGAGADSTSALAFGGSLNAGATAVTEEFNAPYVYYNLHCFVRDLCT